MHYESTFVCVMSKFRSKNSSHLLLDWCGDVGVQDISYLNLEVVQGCNSEGQVHGLTLYHAGIGDGCWGLGQVATSH